MGRAEASVVKLVTCPELLLLMCAPDLLELAKRVLGSGLASNGGRRVLLMSFGSCCRLSSSTMAGVGVGC